MEGCYFFRDSFTSEKVYKRSCVLNKLPKHDFQCNLPFKNYDFVRTYKILYYKLYIAVSTVNAVRVRFDYSGKKRFNFI